MDLAVKIILPIQIMVIHRLIIVDIGKYKILIKYSNKIHLISSSKSTNQSSTSYDGDAQKRFSNAKAISSDQFFNKDSDVRM